MNILENKKAFDKSKILILLPKKSAHFVYDKILKTGVRIDEPYKNFKYFQLIFRFIRKIFFVLNLPFKDIWYGKWKSELEQFDAIILFDFFNVEIINYINKKAKGKKFIFWYWNPVSNSLNPKLIPKNSCEKWSFDKEDCLKYNMKYNTTFFFKDYKLDNSEIEYDIFFIGKDKGRLTKLLNLQKKFDNLGLNTYFHIVNDRNNIYNKNFIYKSPMEYEEVLKNISKSKAILDVVQDNQEGITLRTMEAIFFEKKLITTNKNIINYDFYHKNNIFILGIDNVNLLCNFVNSPYHKISKEIVYNYDFEQWINRFFVE
ncbi:hypothetical protein [Clostridium sp. DJ247]|uniref:hypothetical protein n=1 Tax=Clostridium sp. DJ247 TaxID=2726188 RepID=UPI00162928A8|nr:hypothetical protein [Clostridium sp. DJ247]MBC2581549.1 hypothetical protein [Clostridium sp. DJ247]